MDENHKPMQGTQMAQALKDAGVIPLERGTSRQKARKHRHKNSGRETAPQLPKEESPMNQNDINVSEKNNKKAATADEAMASIAQSLHIAVSAAAEKSAKGEPFMAVATVTPLKRLALESAVKYGVAVGLASAAAVGLRYTVFKPAGQ